MQTFSNDQSNDQKPVRTILSLKPDLQLAELRPVSTMPFFNGSCLQRLGDACFKTRGKIVPHSCQVAASLLAAREVCWDKAKDAHWHSEDERLDPDDHGTGRARQVAYITERCGGRSRYSTTIARRQR